MIKLNRVLLRMLLMVSFAAGAATACAAATTSEPITLRIWSGFKAESELFQSDVDAFIADRARRNDRPVTVSVELVPFDDMVKKLKTAALARRMPDIAFVDVNKMVEMAYGGVLYPLDTLRNFSEAFSGSAPAAGAEHISALRALYVPGAFDTNVITFKGQRHLYGLPAQTTTIALFWNKKLFAAKGDALRAAGLDPTRPPRDWDEFIRYGKIISDPAAGVGAFGYNNSLWFTMPFLNQYQAEVVRRDEKTGKLVACMNSPRGEAATARKVDLNRKYGVEAGAWRGGAPDPEQGFRAQKYAMILMGPWNVKPFRSLGLDFGVSLIPRVPLAEAKSLNLVPPDADENSSAAQSLTVGNVGGNNMIIISDCQHPEVAYEFLLYFSGEKVQREWAEKLGQIPINLAAQKNLDLSKYPEVPTFIEQIKTARPIYPIPNYSIVETDIVNPEMNLVLQGNELIPDALKKMDAAIQTRILDPINAAEEELRRGGK